jgi:signal transduction histidine kinase
VWQDGDVAHVTVADDGPGIAAEDKRRIFERFVRLDDSRARGDGGSGLGLPISREIVLRHGGDIEVDGDGGAVMHIRLPLHPPSAASR